MSIAMAHLAHEAARRNGMRTLREDGWLKVSAGTTSLAVITAPKLTGRDREMSTCRRTALGLPFTIAPDGPLSDAFYVANSPSDVPVQGDALIFFRRFLRLFRVPYWLNLCLPQSNGQVLNSRPNGTVCHPIVHV